MKKILIIFALLVLAICAPTVDAVSVLDGRGVDFNVDTVPERIVAIGPSLTEIVCALGKCEQLVGMDINSDFPENLPDVSRVTNYDLSLNYEEIVALEPDLVLVSELYSEDSATLLERYRVPVFFCENPSDFSELLDQFRKIGILLGEEERAETLCKETENRLSTVAEIVGKIDIVPTVFYEIDAEDPAKPWTTGAGTFVDSLITLAGGKNIAGMIEKEWLQYSLEALIDADPNYILLGDSSYTPLESVPDRPGWADLSAVKDGNVIPFDDNIVSRPGPRLIDGLETMLQILHPEAIEEK